jgi:hypothetical protein
LRECATNLLSPTGSMSRKIFGYNKDSTPYTLGCNDSSCYYE